MTETDNPPEVYKVIGAPGTGKTTRVVGNPELPDVTSLVMENLEEYPFEQQMICTYTKAGTEEAAERLSKILNEPKYLINNRVVTIHAQCYRTLGIEKDQVVRWWHKRNFCKDNNMDYGQDSDDGDIMSADQDEGHSFFDIYGWLKSNRREIEDYKQCPANFNSDKDFVEIAKKWEHYKDEKNLIQFSDMIEQVVEQGKRFLLNKGLGILFPTGDEPAMEVFEKSRWDSNRDPDELRGTGPFVDTKVLYVDEVQDLTPLQWCWYLMQKLVCEKVYIGGDDDQTIYGWAGANPEFMLEEEGDFEVLDKTYRIPADIWQICDGVIKQVEKRQEKDVEPHGDGGEVAIHRRPSPRRIMTYLEETDDAFVLFRARYMIDEFREHLHEYGIPYRNQSTYDTWSDDVVAIRDALAKIESGEDELTGNELETLLEYAKRKCPFCEGDGCNSCGYDGEQNMIADDSGFNQTEKVMSNFSNNGITVERVEEVLDLSHPYKKTSLGARDFLDQCSELNYYEKAAIRGNIMRSNEHLDPDTVRIGTIHSAKGKEAETVIIALDSTQRIVENMIKDTRDIPDKRISDAERRVYYVGMTRASEELVLAQGIIDYENSLNVRDLIDPEDLERIDIEGQWSVQDTRYESGWSR